MTAIPSWISSLSDSVLQADMASAAADGVVSESEMATAVTDLDSELTANNAALSAAQFADLKTIAANLGNGLSCSSYVSYVTNALVNGNALNATWNGGSDTAVTLGNLCVGSTATQLGELAGKWLLGSDLPGGAGYLQYATANLPLFGPSGPSMGDVNQGWLGDCYLEAPLAELASQDPSLIQSMIVDNGNGTFGVRFDVNGVQKWVTVNDQFVQWNGVNQFNSGPALWASLVEKGYAQLQTVNSYDTIGGGGSPALVLAQLTGASQITNFTGGTSTWSSTVQYLNGVRSSATGTSGLSTASVLATLVADLAQGYDAILSSYTDAYDSAGNGTLVAEHAFSIYGYDSSTGMLMLRNPWGDVGSQGYDITFEASLDTLLAAHDVITVDNATGSPSYLAPLLVTHTANQSARAGQAFSYTLPSGTFKDQQGLALSYSATLADGSALPSWLQFNAATGTFSGTAPTIGTTGIIVTASDATGVSVSESFSFSFTASAPTRTYLLPASKTELVGQAFSFSIAGGFSDPQGSALTYSATLADGSALPSWLHFDAASQTFSGSSNAVGTTAVLVTATDALGASSHATINLNLYPPAPQLAQQTGTQVEAAGQAFSFTVPAVTFTDPQGLALTYGVVGTLPSWLQFDASTGTFSGTPTGTGVTSVMLYAGDPYGQKAYDVFNFFVPGAPAVSQQTADQAETVGRAFSYAVPFGTFADPQGSALTYSATLADGTALPSWLHFNAATGTFSGTPTAAGTTTVVLTATDAYGLSASETFSFVTSAPLAAPVLARQTANQAGLTGQAFAYTLPSGTFTDPQGSALTYSATLADGSALPSWLKFDAASGTFSGTPTAAGTTTVMLTATDAYGLKTSETFSIAVAAPAAPVIAQQTANQAETVGQAFTYALAAGTFTDPQGGALTYSATLAGGTALPPWLSFDAATGTFSGTPTAAGATAVMVTATDSLGLSTSETFSFVTNAVAPALTQQTATQTEGVGKAFTFTLPAGSFSDPQGSALTYSARLASGAALPSWLHFNAATGTFSGTPTAAGTTSVRVTVVDAYGLSASETFSFTAVTLRAPQLAHQTASQTETAGKAFSYTLAANTFSDPQGSALTYTAKLSSGSALPSWLHFDAGTGTFSGTPTALGTTSVTVTATDGWGLSTRETFSFVSTAKAPTLVQQTAAQAEILGQAFSYTVAAGTFSDPQGSALKFTAKLSSGSALPSWLHFDATTCTFSGTPPSAGTFSVVLTATDAFGLSARETVSFTASRPALSAAPSLAFRDTRGIVGTIVPMPWTQQHRDTGQLAAG